MGVNARKPFLPAPTDSSIAESNGGSVTPTDLATDLSQKSDKSSHTVPDDGSPITIPTGDKRSKPKGHNLSKLKNHSQTSLLIEYFEGSKEQGLISRPSVRVKVSPSTKDKAGNPREDQIVVTQSQGARKPSYRRRISLAADTPKQKISTAESTSSISPLSQESRRLDRRAPVELELGQPQDSQISINSPSKDDGITVPLSDISSMPPDSMLDDNMGANSEQLAPSHNSSKDDLDHNDSTPTPNRRRSRSLTKDRDRGDASSRTPTRRKSRSLSRERLTQKVLEKLANKPRETSVDQQKRHHAAASSRSGSKDASEGEMSIARSSGPHKEHGSITSATDSSAVTNTVPATKRKSSDQASFLSGTSKSSVNNPKLLDAFEDVLRRVIIPELKELKKDKKVSGNRSKFENIASSSDASLSSISRGEPQQRRRSKHANPKEQEGRRRTSSDKGSGGSRRRQRQRKEMDLDSPSERSSRRRQSGESLSLDEDQNKRRREKNRGLRHAAAGTLVGGALTAAALHHHDSRSSLERSDQRKRRSRGNSRSTGAIDSEEIFEKHGVPPMPLRSDLETELTRSSLLSDHTSATPVKREVRQVYQGLAREMSSPRSTESTSSVSSTPRKAPGDLRQGLGTHHGNLSHRDLSTYGRGSLGDPAVQHGEAAESGLPRGTAPTAMSPVLTDEDRHRRYEDNLHHQYPIRSGLSPIQSVASYNTSEPARNSTAHPRSSPSLTPLSREHPIDSRSTPQSLSSAASPSFARSRRPQGINLETQSEVFAAYADSSRRGSRDMNGEAFSDKPATGHRSQRNSYASHDSHASSDLKVDPRRLTNLTDDSDRVNSGQRVNRGRGNNPTYVDPSTGIESAVASLYDPSVESVRSSRTGTSQTDSVDRQKLANRQAGIRGTDSGSPLKREHTKDGRQLQGNGISASPPQSVAQSDDSHSEPRMGISGVPVLSDPMPEIGVGLDSPQSEITTNPSVIHGPIGGTSPPGSQDPWSHGAAASKSLNRLVPPSGEDRELGMSESADAQGLYGAAAGALGIGMGKMPKDTPTGLSQKYGPTTPFDYNQNHDSFITDPSASTPPKDEGYISAANAGAHSPDPKSRDLPGKEGATARPDRPAMQEDPFMAARDRNADDSLNGIEAIQSKDIVALMDHV